MKLLAIVCLDGDERKFIDNNKEFIDGATESGKISLVCCTQSSKPGETRYERYRKALSEEAQFFMFVNDSTVLPEKTASILLNELETFPEILTLRIRAGKTIKYSDILNAKFPFYLPKYVFSREFLNSVYIIENEEPYFDEVLIAEASSRKFLLSEASVNSTSEEYLETKLDKYKKGFDSAWYRPSVESFIIPRLKAGTGADQQVMLLYLIWDKYKCNQGSYNKMLMDPDEIEAFEASVDMALNLFDEGTFFAEPLVKKIGLNNCEFLYRKIKDAAPGLEIVKSKKGRKYYVDGTFAGKDLLTPHIYAINIENNFLSIYYIINGDVFELAENGIVRVIVNDQTCLSEYTGVSFTIQYFGDTAFGQKVYRTEIPLGEEMLSISFDYKGNESFSLPIEFKKVASRLTEKSTNSYCELEGYLLRYSENTITITKGKAKRALKNTYTKELVKQCRTKRDALRMKALRELHNAGILKPKKPVWLFFDKLYKGGDNGEALFSYAYKNVDYADSYYIINGDTDDYKRLSSEYGDHILKFNTFRLKLISLYADILFATHIDVFRSCSYGTELREKFRGELKAKVVCIQHGLTIQDMPENQNRVLDNTLQYFCASPKEIENLSQSSYGYREDQLHLTGLPRYDGLRSDDKKQILIAPTWRKEIVISGNKRGTAKDYNPRFKDSVYYEIYSNLINNSKLIECAKDTGYKVIFLLHPTIGAQLRDFKENGYVQVVNGAQALYDPLLSESSVMVTDYSGVQFDFAYMMKPVVYYHPEELPPHYENSHFSYEDDGFGPIVAKQGELVDMLCDGMRQGFDMQKKYKERVESFFAFTDHNNCKRICDTIKELYY